MHLIAFVIVVGGGLLLIDVICTNWVAKSKNRSTAPVPRLMWGQGGVLGVSKCGCCNRTMYHKNLKGKVTCWHCGFSNTVDANDWPFPENKMAANSPQRERVAA